MNTTDLKVFCINTSTMLISFSNLENTMKILLLMVSIGYTVQKWYYMNKKNGRGQ